MTCARYPSVEHERAARQIVDLFAREPGVLAVLLTCSCARGRATPDSCLDVAVLLSRDLAPGRRALLEQTWAEADEGEAVFADLRRVGAFSHVDLSFFDGAFVPPYHGWMTGPDEFELEIGNLLVYSVPLWERGGDLAQLKARWLPYYGEPLRQERAAMVGGFLRNNLAHIPLYVARGLYFQAHHRLMLALGEFLQALFIARRTYPIAYDKWIREQIVELLGLPELYRQLVGLLEIERLESDEIARKAETLRALYQAHCT
ncbi:MAG: hypothetical protein JXA09_00345 [Anaerolineae bacterium]|nr:hypothetical protein [Anaerolineae bacterium]